MSDLPGDPPEPRSTLIRVAPGAKVIGLHVSDSAVIGADFIDNQGEMIDANLSRNIHVGASEHPEVPAQEASDSAEQHWYKGPLGLIGLALP